MDYKVVWTLDKSFSEAIKSITRETKDLCSHGWKPQGGISVIFDKNYYYVCQAIVK